MATDQHAERMNRALERRAIRDLNAKVDAEERRMTLREVKEALDEFYDDVLDLPLQVEDQYGGLAYVTSVESANGAFLWPSKDFEDEDALPYGRVVQLEELVTNLRFLGGQPAMSIKHRGRNEAYLEVADKLDALLSQESEDGDG